MFSLDQGCQKYRPWARSSLWNLIIWSPVLPLYLKLTHTLQKAHAGLVPYTASRTTLNVVVIPAGPGPMLHIAPVRTGLGVLCMQCRPPSRCSMCHMQCSPKLARIGTACTESRMQRRGGWRGDSGPNPAHGASPTPFIQLMGQMSLTPLL